MLNVRPVTLTDGRIRLEPLSLDHVDALKAAAADGELWKLRVTSVPDPDDTRGYVERALAMREQGHRLPFVVVDLENKGRIIGSTSYHDIVPAIDRLEIGWTWYAKSAQRSHVNTCAKLLLLVHAFETLGAKKDGVLRHHALRRDGTVRDTVMYSVTAGEWPQVKAHLLHQQGKPRG